MRKKLWTFLAGFCGIIAFYSIIGVIALYIVFDIIAAETSQDASLFDYWYQTLLFIIAILSTIGLATFITMICIDNRKNKEVSDESV